MAWIGNGESGSSVRGKLNALSIPISSGKVTSPVSYFDVALPAGYDMFTLNVVGLSFTDLDFCAASYSTDGGTTFLNDPLNLDTYRIGDTGGNFLDGLLYCLGSRLVAANQTYSGFALNIMPGDSSYLASSWVSGLEAAAAGGTPFYEVDGHCLNIGATNAPTPARINAIRVQPYGNGDANPPTSSHTIALAKYFLFGIPTI